MITKEIIITISVYNNEQEVVEFVKKISKQNMGKKEKSETTFTRYEFEKQLNCLKEFLKKESN